MVKKLGIVFSGLLILLLLSNINYNTNTVVFGQNTSLITPSNTTTNPYTHTKFYSNDNDTTGRPVTTITTITHHHHQQQQEMQPSSPISSTTSAPTSMDPVPSPDMESATDSVDVETNSVPSPDMESATDSVDVETNSVPSATVTKLTGGIKIDFPGNGATVPSNANSSLIINGVSKDNATSNCDVSLIINGVKPYQNVQPAGAGGENDYSYLAVYFI